MLGHILNLSTPRGLLRIAVLAAACWGTILLFQATLAPVELAAQEYDCAACHTTSETECKSCHDPAGGGTIVLEYDPPPVCAFVPGADPCQTVSFNQCSGIQVVVQFLTGSLENCRSVTQQWHWT